MARWEVPERIRPLVEELRSLVRPGLAAAEALDLPELSALAAARGTTVRVLVRSAVVELTGQSRKKAETVLAIGMYQGVDATTRYAAAADIHGSLDWDHFRHQPLLRLLVEVCGSLQDATIPLTRARPLPDANTADASLNDYSLDLLEVTEWIPARVGGRRRILEHRVLRAGPGGLRAWIGTHAIDAEGAIEEQAAVEVQHFGQGALQVSPVADRFGLVRLEIEFGRPLPESRTAEFWLVKNLVVQDNGIDFSYWGLTPTRAVRDYRVNLMFEKAPREVWRFENVQRYARPGLPASDRIVYVDELGFATATFTDPTVGLSSGLAWWTDLAL